MIQTVIFDIGNVLSGFDWKPNFERLGYEGETLRRLAAATAENVDWREYDRGCKTDEEMLELFIENDPGIEKEIRRAMASMKGMMSRFDYSIPWIQALKAKGYQVLVLSNFSDKALRECWCELDFLPYVDGGILSFKEKLIKPMPEIYHLILERYHLKPEECVFLDDTQVNVDAARALGINAIHFENREQAVAALRELGVES